MFRTQPAGDRILLRPWEFGLGSAVLHATRRVRLKKCPMPELYAGEVTIDTKANSYLRLNLISTEVLSYIFR